MIAGHGNGRLSAVFPGATGGAAAAADGGALSRAHLLDGVTGPERRALAWALSGTGDRPIDTAAPLLPSLAGCRTALDARAIGRGRGYGRRAAFRWRTPVVIVMQLDLFFDPSAGDPLGIHWRNRRSG